MEKVLNSFGIFADFLLQKHTPTNQRYSPSVRAEALSLRRDGLGVSGIARKVHASPQIVSYWIRQERKMSEKRGLAGNPTHP